MNKQDIFNKVSSHLLSQGKKCQAVNNKGQPIGECRYRQNKEAHDTMRCGIGAIIPDSLYHPVMEGNGVRSLLATQIKEIKSLVTNLKILWEINGDSDITFLASLQNIHDTQNVESWEDSLRLFAVNQGLSFK